MEAKSVREGCEGKKKRGYEFLGWEKGQKLCSFSVSTQLANKRFNRTGFTVKPADFLLFLVFNYFSVFNYNHTKLVVNSQLNQSDLPVWFLKPW